jgi:coproporphyrinogen III oxidase
MNSIKEDFVTYIRDLQNRICDVLEKEDGGTKFVEESWERTEGGGGITRVIENGNIFEKGGVNTSTVHGIMTSAIKNQLHVEGERFFACGISLVIHPFNPMVPTVHANFRYFELYDQDTVVDCWFGGGADLTPYYLWEEDVVHFHQSFKTACDSFDTNRYPKYKKQCDEYFNNIHRGNERRGVGGIFYDYERPTDQQPASRWLDFTKANGDGFVKAYLPIVKKRKTLAFGEEEKRWQQIRRGRYVEFNLIHDRGTLFGLKSNGRTESILMSLPPTARFDYHDLPAAGSREEKLIHILKNPKDWC